MRTYRQTEGGSTPGKARTMDCKCDFCGTENPDIIVDGRTKSGPWAWMCLEDFLEKGVGLGIGRGQRYDAIA